MANTLRIISSMATRQILSELVAAHTSAGRPIQLESVGGVDAARRVRSGEAVDIIVLAADALKDLANEGHVASDTVRVFALSPTAAAVPTGTPHAGSCDAPSLKALIAGGKRIALSTGPSGKSMAQLLQSWQADSTSQNLIVQAPPGVPVARLLARGEADVGFQQLSELLGEPGIDIVGTLPAAVQPMTAFACGISATATDRAAALDLMTALLSPEAAAIKRRGGMEPAE